jgi:hypothetical protein
MYPVRVRRDAFASGMPCRDPWLSPDHAVHADSVLIPIKHLVNGRGVTREDGRRSPITPIELAEHAELLRAPVPHGANG